MAQPNDQIGVLFVCLGNICRSPTAEAVFRKVLDERGIAKQFRVDSCGTHAYKAGAPPDPRAQQEARKHGIVMHAHRARKLMKDDFARFDYICPMDEENYKDVMWFCPKEHAHKVRRFVSFAPTLGRREVPDPYSGGPRGFEEVFELCRAGAEGLLEHILEERELVPR